MEIKEGVFDNLSVSLASEDVPVGIAHLANLGDGVDKEYLKKAWALFNNPIFETEVNHSIRQILLGLFRCDSERDMKGLQNAAFALQQFYERIHGMAIMSEELEEETKNKDNSIMDGEDEESALS